MTPGMEQGMRQSMVATAAMQMFMRALQSTTWELSQLAAEAIAANPVLEELPPPPGELEGDDAPYTLDREATARHDFFMDSLAEQETLCGHLQEQLRRSALPPAVEQAAIGLCTFLDEHGRFTEPPAAAAGELGLPPDIFHQALLAVQDLDPAGVGAADLRESLILQLRRKGENGGLAMRLLLHHWDDLVRHRYAEAAAAMEVDEEAVALAAKRIARLNPDPGSAFARTEQQIIEPDIIVSRPLSPDGTPADRLEVNPGKPHVPRLGLSGDYRNLMAERAEDAGLRRYLSKCFRDARELIKAIDDRQQTILAVATALVKRQRAYFLGRQEAPAPLKMEDIARDTGLHVSTISRAVRGKYLKSDRGVSELRSFFSAALPAGTGEESVSAAAVQAQIRALIAAENPRKPLSDAKLESALAAKGITVARRTIAKYREQLKILPASMRKNLG